MRLKYCTGSWLLFTLLKHQGLSDFQITIGLVSLAPTAFTMKVTVICCLDCFHSLVESFVRKSSPIATSLIEIPYVLSTVALQNIWKSLLLRIDSSTRHITGLTTYFHLPDIVALFPTIKPSTLIHHNQGVQQFQVLSLSRSYHLDEHFRYSQTEPSMKSLIQTRIF